MLFDDLPLVGVAGVMLMLILLGAIRLSIGRPDRACVDCKHYRPNDGTCHNACPPERDLVLGIMRQRVVLAAEARAASDEGDWCGRGAHRFEPRGD